MDYLSDEMLLGLGVLVGIVALVIIILGSILAIFRSIALYTMAKNAGLPNPWLAWIPIAGAYTFGAVADAASLGKPTYYRYFMLGAEIIVDIFTGGFFSYLSLVPAYTSAFRSIYGWTYGLGGLPNLFSLAYYVLTVIVLYNIFRAYKLRSATSYTVLSAIPITSFLQSILLFSVRNNQRHADSYMNTPAGYQYQPPSAPTQGWQPPQQDVPNNQPNPKDQDNWDK